MSDVENPNMVVKSDIAKPLHYQILEKSLDIEPFLTYVEKYLQDLSGDDGDVSSNSEEELVEVNTITGETIWNGVAATREDRRLDRERYFNLSKVRENRRWLRDVLVTDSSESSSDEEVTEEDLKHMLREHLMRKKYKRKFLQNSQHHQYQYYSAGLLSNYDKFPEHQADVLGVSRKKKGSSGTSKRDRSARHSNDSDTNQDHDSQDLDGKDDDASMSEVFKPFSSSKKKKSHKKKSRTAEIMAAKRRKIWSNMAKKEVGKVPPVYT